MLLIPNFISNDQISDQLFTQWIENNPKKNLNSKFINQFKYKKFTMYNRNNYCTIEADITGASLSMCNIFGNICFQKTQEKKIDSESATDDANLLDKVVDESKLICNKYRYV